MVMFHGHGTRRSLRKHACNISSLLISLSDFFYKLVVEGLLSRHSGFISRCLFHIVVHSFLCGLFAPALRWRSSPASRLTSRGSRLPFRCSQLPARVGSFSRDERYVGRGPAPVDSSADRVGV